ncbi:hypothetical protein [[Mycoplasma] testudinis]|uniref:hypothetical protein n=1 Tax=[Mycoplasma] testudinis TaxID=33924 RepID=UPI0004886D1B|nr:hypothetical protein [[Mycoplasma] testudinis]
MIVLTIIGAVVIPLIYLFNSYFIGRFLKRFYPQLTSFTLTGLGFFVMLMIIFILTLPVYVVPVNFLGYLVLLAITQGLLIIAYALNWRYSFSISEFNLLSFSFFVILAITLTGTWFLSNNLSQEINLTVEGQNINQFSSLITYLQKPVSLNSIVFNPLTDSESGQYVAWNAINLSWIFMFNINATNIGETSNLIGGIFTTYGLLAIYSIITSAIVVGVFNDYILRRDFFRIFSIWAIMIIINAPMFLLTKTPVNGVAWIVPLSILIIRLMFDSITTSWNYRLDLICAVLLISGHTLSVSLIIFNFTIVVLKVLLSFLNKSPHTTTSSIIFSLGVIFPLILVVQSFSIVGSIVFSVLLICFYILWFILISRLWFKERVVIYENWMHRKISWFLIVFISLIYIVSVILMFSGGRFEFDSRPWIILPNPFLDTSNIVNFNQSLQIVLNVGFWVITIVIFLFYFSSTLLRQFNTYNMILGFIQKRSRAFVHKTIRVIPTRTTIEIGEHGNLLNSYNKSDSPYLQRGTDKNYYGLFSLLVMLLVWNPLSTNLMNRIAARLPFDLSWLFFLAIVPSLFTYALPKSKAFKTILTILILLVGIGLNVALGFGNYFFNTI